MSDYALAPGITCCDAGGRHVFLDLEADRYFCLGPEFERAFAALIARHPLTAGDQINLTMLVSRGILTHTQNTFAGLNPARSIPPRQAAIDARETAALAHMALAAAMLLKSKRALRRGPLAKLIADVRSAKSNLRTTMRDGRVDLAAIADAFRRAALITGSLDECLAVSLAVAHRCLSRCLPVELILGVKLRPFQAHAWVQAGDLLISDSLDTIAPFTPILVV